MPEQYEAPVDRLLSLGEPEMQHWIDYPGEIGIQQEHVSALIRILEDYDLRELPPEDDAVWTPVHAWRAIGQLRSEAAVEAVLKLLAKVDIWCDWENEELPVVLGMIGPAAIPGLTRLLNEEVETSEPNTAAAEGLKEVARRHPESRTAVVDLLMQRLSHFNEQEVVLTTALVCYLTELEAVEAADLMEAAFAADKVDISWQGDWEDVQIDLGLLSERLTPKPNYHRNALWLGSGSLPAKSMDKEKKNKQKKKKRKAAQASRKRNRR